MSTLVTPQEEKPQANYERGYARHFALEAVEKAVDSHLPVQDVVWALVSNLYVSDSSFTIANYEACVEKLAELYGEAERSRQSTLFEEIAYGDLPADAETKLLAYISTRCLDNQKNSERHAVELCALPYPEFLKSEYWSLIRTVMVGRSKGECQLCRHLGPLHVHHKTYDHHGFEHAHLDDLICLCRLCHAKFHDKLPNPAGSAGR